MTETNNPLNQPLLSEPTPSPLVAKLAPAAPKVDWTNVPYAERKRRLLAEGALLRLGMVDARMVVRHNLDPQTIAKGALRRAADVAYTLIGGVASVDGPRSLKAASPLITSILTSVITSRIMRKPLIYGGVVSALGSLLYMMRKRRQPDGVDDVMSADYQ